MYGRGMQRLRAHYPLLKVLLLSSLEDSWQTAEALYARAFGVGKRSCFSTESWHLGDTIVALGALVVGLVYGASLLHRNGVMKFYPVLDCTMGLTDAWMLATLALGGMMLPLLDIGWRRWNSSISAT